MKLDFTACDDAGCKVEHIRIAIWPRPRECERIGAEHRPRPTCGSDSARARRHCDCRDTVLCQGLDFGPQGGEVIAVIDRQYSDTLLAGLLDKKRSRSFK